MDRWGEDNMGVTLMILAQFFGAGMGTVTRLLETDEQNGAAMHPLQILFARQSITMMISLLYMWWQKVPDAPMGKREVRWLLVARGFGGFFGVYGFYCSLVYLPLGEAIVITFIAPIVAAWVCSILIKTPFTRTQQIAGVISLSGVVLIAQPLSLFNAPATSAVEAQISNSTIGPTGNGTNVGSDQKIEGATPAQHALAIALGLVGVCGAASAYTTISWIGKRAHPLISVNYFATWCTLISAIALLFVPGIDFRMPATPREWLLMLTLGFAGFIMQFLMTAGLAYRKSNRALNMVYCQMLFALAMDKLVWDLTPGWVSLAGSSLILGSVVWVAVKEQEGGKVEKREQGRDDEERGLVDGTDGEDGNYDGESTTIDDDIQEGDQRGVEMTTVTH